MPKPALGSIVGGKYKLLRALGEGGMGTVYEVEHQLTHKRAAIKWVHPHTDSSDSAHERLLHEARATSRIHHRNVVDVYDVLREDDAVCLVMQLLVGEPLSELIARGAMPFSEFVALLLPAMRGVAAAHAAGVIHRDIKPDNIFLARESGHAEVIPKVIDFGISKVFDPKSSEHVTRSGITMGTPKYVSYEQLLGSRAVDGRADVYAFGVMLYEALTGEPPYRASTFGEQAVAFAMSVPARPSVLRANIPPALDAVVYRAIAKERDQRIGCIEALITELEPFLRSEAYPEPLTAFPGKSQPRVQGAPEPHETTAPAVPTPASQSRVDLALVHVAPTPHGPVPQPEGPARASRAIMRRRSRRLSALISLAVAVCGLGFLVWRFQVPVPSNQASALVPLHTNDPPHESVSTEVPAPSLPSEPAALGVKVPAEELVATGVMEPTSAPSAASARDAADQVLPRPPIAPKTAKAPLRSPSASSTAAPAEERPARERISPARSSTPEPSLERASASEEAHRAGGLARDEF